MLRKIRRRKSVLAAIAAGLMAVPALFAGVAAAPSDPSDPLLPGDDPGQPLPPDPFDQLTSLTMADAYRVRDLAPLRYQELLVEVAHRHRVDPRLVAAVITVETNWDPDAVGYHHEQGLMQILPSTGAFLARLAGLTVYDLADPATSLDLGVRYLAALHRQYGSQARALAAYNGGPEAVSTWESNPYVHKVLGLYERTPGKRTQTTTMLPAS